MAKSGKGTRGKHKELSTTPQEPVLASIPWLEEAVARFPELVEALTRFEEPDGPLIEFVRQKLDTPYMLWNELQSLWAEAWRGDPPNTNLIDRVHNYAHWCEAQPQGQTADDDLNTAVVVSFYEHIAQVPAAMRDMPNRFTWSQIEKSREVFCYFVGDEGFKKMKTIFEDHAFKNRKKAGR